MELERGAKKGKEKLVKVFGMLARREKTRPGEEQRRGGKRLILFSRLVSQAEAISQHFCFLPRLSFRRVRHDGELVLFTRLLSGWG